MTMNIQIIPDETLLHIFTYLTNVENIRCKATCKSWRVLAARHCGYILLQMNSASKFPLDVINGHLITFTIKAEECFGSNCAVGNGKASVSGEETSYVDIAYGGTRRRARGHLPQPNVMSLPQTTGKDVMTQHVYSNYNPGVPNECNTSTRCMELLDRVKENTVAIAMRLEYIDAQVGIEKVSSRYLSSLDLECSKLACDYTLLTPLLPSPNSKTIKSLTVKRMMKVLDLSSLCHLKCLSVRGCSGLVTLRIPPCLMGLDASGCTQLKEILLPPSIISGEESEKKVNKVEDQQTELVTPKDEEDSSVPLSLQALNLNGCRSLHTCASLTNSGSTSVACDLLSQPGALRMAQEVDLTSVRKLPEQIMASSLSSAEHLVNLSLRYVATDYILDAIASCNRAMDSLCLLDLAFSFGITDASIKKLVMASIKLERCNLRGCRNISGDCYNQVPIYLSNRLNNGSDIVLDKIEDENTRRKRRRKGDNIFYFTNQK